MASLLHLIEPSYMEQLVTGFVTWFYIDVRYYLILASGR